MGGFGMERPTQVTLLDIKRDLSLRITELAQSAFISAKKIAKDNNALVIKGTTSQVVREILLHELHGDVELLNKIIEDGIYGIILLKVHELIAAETKSVEEDKYLVRQGVPQREALTDQSSTTNPKPANTPAVPKVGIQEAAIARHEPDQLVLKDGVWIKESEL
jgi:hypothetical protein